MHELPQRKPTRLKEFDYRTTGSYFVTICTKNKQKLLGMVKEGKMSYDSPYVELSQIGKKVEQSIRYIGLSNSEINVDHYVVMPNHVHLLLSLTSNGNVGNISIPQVIGKFKSYTTRQYGEILWQRSFHDHIVRSKRAYEVLWNYIDGNPAKWLDDCFYLPD